MVDPPERPSPDPDEAIMRATYRALRAHGYADLTIERIAEEYGKSTAAVHYHYDTKDDLLAAFLDYLLDRFVAAIHEVETTDPEQRLDLLLDQLLLDAEDHYDLLIATLEMQSTAPYKEAFADRFESNEAYVRYMLRTAIDHEIEEGTYSDVDADHAARALMTIVYGGRTRAVVLGDTEALATARRTADEYVSAVLR